MPYRPKTTAKKSAPAAGRSKKKKVHITIPKSFKDSAGKVKCGAAGRGTKRGNRTAAKVLAVCEAIPRTRKVNLPKKKKK